MCSLLVYIVPSIHLAELTEPVGTRSLVYASYMSHRGGMRVLPGPNTSRA